MLKLP
jgi:hypothetical protein